MLHSYLSPLTQIVTIGLGFGTSSVLANRAEPAWTRRLRLGTAAVSRIVVDLVVDAANRATATAVAIRIGRARLMAEESTLLATNALGSLAAVRGVVRSTGVAY